MFLDSMGTRVGEEELKEEFGDVDNIISLTDSLIKIEHELFDILQIERRLCYKMYTTNLSRAEEKGMVIQIFKPLSNIMELQQEFGHLTLGEYFPIHS